MRSNRKIIFGLLLIVGAVGFYRLFRLLAPGTPSQVAKSNPSANGDPNLRPASLKTSVGRVAETRVNIPANTIVTPDMLRMVSYEGPSTQGFITDIEAQGAGYITRVDIPAKVKIRPQYDFVGHVSETGIAGLLRPGTRAMVIPMANKPTLHDLVRIGNFVDVLAAFDGQESRTIVQNVRVLGVDLSGNDYPNVNVAMRGPSKADPKQGGVSAEAAAAGPTPTPSAPPANAPRPDPALTLEVTPQQAAALQLAMASNATLDYLVRPALPGNVSAEIAPLPGDASSPNGEGTLQTVSVTKRQIAPYAESRKNANNAATNQFGKSVMNALTGAMTAATKGNGRSGGGRPLENLGGGPVFPTSGSDSTLPVIVPPGTTGTGTTVTGTTITGPTPRPVPTPTQIYNIPIYGDGRVVRTETVPLPAPSR